LLVDIKLDVLLLLGASSDKFVIIWEDIVDDGEKNPKNLFFDWLLAYKLNFCPHYIKV